MQPATIVGENSAKFVNRDTTWKRNITIELCLQLGRYSQVSTTSNHSQHTRNILLIIEGMKKMSEHKPKLSN